MWETRKVYIVRHGKIQTADRERRYIGHMDVPLNDAGIKQAEYLRDRLADIEFDAVYCSDLSRSRQTAQIIAAARNISIIANKALREIDVGDWEDCTFFEVSQRFPTEFAARGANLGYYPFPGGESFADCNKRVLSAFRKILKAGDRDILFVGHAGVNRLLLCDALGLPLNHLFRIAQDYGCLNLIEYSQEGCRVKLMNNTF